MFLNELPLDPNLSISDFEKLTHSLLSHVAFEALDEFKSGNSGKKPTSWNKTDCEVFINIAKKIIKEKKYDLDIENSTEESVGHLNYLSYFAF